MIPEADIPSPQDDEEEEGSRQNQDDRLAETHEAMYGKAQDAASGIEIALETTTSSQQGSEKREKSGERIPNRHRRKYLMMMKTKVRKPAGNARRRGK